ncbi:unnamed protein product [Cercopithifilaria johnstoni]|uniref:Uncharacterized protein n=1 Tax=Cercopithifilaria johnstoni TaxID=2874296 RepID=A0A8J2MLI5_9BILA|nr:unnamed protein product [Cercopithifilaria johnstoni]
MLNGDDLHMAIDVVNDQQLMPMLSNYHTTQHFTDTLSYTASNNNTNSDNIDGVNNDNNNDDDLSNIYRHHRTIRFVRRRKRFATAQTSRWDKMTSDNVLKLKWYISRYTRDMPRSEIRYFIY